MSETPELSAEAIRVLGCLMEKAITTPEYYPLTLNALTLACNQKSSRDPVTDYDDNEVLATLDSLREKGYVMRVDVAGSRVPKFRHRLQERWELNDATYAALCVLFLRGPQTPGQIRQRTDRLHSFVDTDAVENALNQLADRDEEPHVLVRELPRSAGFKEARWVHVFWQEAEMAADNPAERNSNASARETHISREELVQRVEVLEARLESLSQEFESFRKLFGE